MPTTFNKAIPLFFFHLALNAFTEIGLIGQIQKKKKKITRSLGGPDVKG